MQGTIVKVVAEDGQQVAAGDPVVVLEAMKMEQPLTAHKAGTVTGLAAEVGATRHQRRSHLRDQGLTDDPAQPPPASSETFRRQKWTSRLRNVSVAVLG